MITEFFLQAVYLFFHQLMQLFPDAPDLPAGLTSALTYISVPLSKLNHIFPVDTFLVVLGLMLTIESFILFFKFINFVLNKIRGSG